MSEEVVAAAHEASQECLHRVVRGGQTITVAEGPRAFLRLSRVRVSLQKQKVVFPTRADHMHCHFPRAEVGRSSNNSNSNSSSTEGTDHSCLQS